MERKESRVDRNRVIYRQFKEGKTLEELSEQFQLKPSAVKGIVDRFTEEIPHWTDSLTVNARSLLLKWAKRKGYRREQLSKDYVRNYILNGTFRYPGLGPMLMTEITQLLEIEYVAREV